MMTWIDIKKTLPPLCGNGTKPYVLAYHTCYGVGVAWFWVIDEGGREDLEEDFEDKYLCSCEFVLPKTDGNWEVASDNDIDIFERSPHFLNLGTVTHWMALPKQPEVK